MALEIFSEENLAEKALAKSKTSKNKSQRPAKKQFLPDVFEITDIKQAIRNPNRLNIFVNGKYRFSLDAFQLVNLNIKIGAKFSSQEISELEQQSEFGKLYARALEYCLMRPRSEKEMKDYLWKKTLNKRLKNKKTGEIYEKSGVSKMSTEQVLARLKEKDYINDERFARWWIDNRNQRKGTSLKKLRQELQQKGVDRSISEQLFSEASRNDQDELQKVIIKKSRQYSDEQKLIAYLLRQGFLYDDIKRALSDESD